MSKFIFKHKLGEKFLFKGIECQVGYINNGNAWLSPIKDDAKLGLYKGCSFVVIDKHRESADGTIAISQKMLDKIYEKLMTARINSVLAEANPCGAA